MTKLGILGTLKLLIRALGVYASHQAAIANELRILNAHIARIWPDNVTITAAPKAEEPDLGDDPYTLAVAEDAATVLRSELGREASTDELLERMTAWRERKDPIGTRGNMIDGR